jgi:hypothetical protein
MVSCGSSAVLLLLVLTAVLASPLDYVLESQVQGVVGQRVKRQDGWKVDERRDSNGRLIKKDYFLQHKSDNFDADAVLRELPGGKKAYQIGATFRF